MSIRLGIIRGLIFGSIPYIVAIAIYFSPYSCFAADTYFSPDGNPEVWEKKPNGYYTVEEWEAMQPEPEPVERDLTAEKAQRIQMINLNTEIIKLRDGLSYAGERFSLTSDAMIKWTGLMAAKDILPFPVTILTIDDKSFTLENQTALMQFVAAVLMYETDPGSPVSIGRALRQRIEAATTLEELDAIVDTRK